MEDPRMKKHLGLARDAGTKAMAKDFFAETPGAGGPAEGESDPMAASAGGGEMPSELAALTPEQLEELLALLAQQGGGEAPPEGM